MTTLPVSRTVLALLLASVSAALITTLAPDQDNANDGDDLLPAFDTTSGRVLPPIADVTTDFRRPRAAPAARHAGAKNITAFGGLAPVAPPAPTVAPPPAPLLIAQPPPPRAPAASFVYLGRLSQGDRDFVFLLDGEDAIAVTAGSAINAQWTLEKASETELLLRHVSLNQTTTLRIAP